MARECHPFYKLRRTSDLPLILNYIRLDNFCMIQNMKIFICSSVRTIYILWIKSFFIFIRNFISILLLLIYNPAFQCQWIVFDNRNIDNACFFQFQSGFFDFIHISSGVCTAKANRFSIHFPIRNIYCKYRIFVQQLFCKSSCSY